MASLPQILRERTMGYAVFDWHVHRYSAGKGGKGELQVK